MNKPYTNVDFKNFLKKKGLPNIKVTDLEEIIKKEGLDVLELTHFQKIFEIVSTRESNNTIKRATWVIGVFALITTICAIISIFN